MAVHLTKIYTKTGDDGTTALGDFTRVRKTDVRLAAYADTDECNAAIGVAVTVGGLAEAVLVAAAPGAERPVRRRRGPVQPDRREPEVPAAAGDRGVRHPSRGLVRRVQRGPAEARLVHPAGRHARGRVPARGADGHAPRRALGLGPAGGRRRAHEPADGALPQPALGPAVHPGSRREPGRRRPVAPGRAMDAGTCRPAGTCRLARGERADSRQRTCRLAPAS